MEGEFRAAIESMDDDGDLHRGPCAADRERGCSRGRSSSAHSTLVEQFEKYVSMSKKVPSEVLTSLSGIDEPGRLG